MNDLRTAAQQALEAMKRGVPTGKITLHAWDKAMSDLDAALAQQQQAEPTPGKVVAWGIFALSDGEWVLQNPVYLGDEFGKENAEFERSTYSGPQPLEVRPLCVAPLKSEPAQGQANPPGCDHCNHPLYAATKCRVCGRVTEPKEQSPRWEGDHNIESPNNACMHKSYCMSLKAEPAQEPVDVGLLEYRGNSVAFIHQKMTAYRAGIDAAWDAFRAKGLHPDGKTPLADMIAKYTAPPKLVPLTEEEIEAIAATNLGDYEDGKWFLLFARAIERALEEKNRGG